MPSRKKRRSSTPDSISKPAPAPSARRLGEPELLAIVAAVLCGVHAWLAGFALNPDGVSYLDLANRVASGDWASLVQGYWSPFYPALIGILSGSPDAIRPRWLHWPMQSTEPLPSRPSACSGGGAATSNALI
jgi:hypothetical protein